MVQTRVNSTTSKAGYSGSWFSFTRAFEAHDGS